MPSALKLDLTHRTSHGRVFGVLAKKWSSETRDANVPFASSVNFELRDRQKLNARLTELRKLGKQWGFRLERRWLPRYVPLGGYHSIRMASHRIQVTNGGLFTRLMADRLEQCVALSSVESA